MTTQEKIAKVFAPAAESSEETSRLLKEALKQNAELRAALDQLSTNAVDVGS
jgi:hypothetical protein